MTWGNLLKSRGTGCATPSSSYFCEVKVYHNLYLVALTFPNTGQNIPGHLVIGHSILVTLGSWVLIIGYWLLA